MRAAALALALLAGACATIPPPPLDPCTGEIADPTEDWGPTCPADAAY